MPDATHNDALPTAPFHSRSSLSDNPDFAQIHKFKRTEQALKWQAGVFLDANNDYGYIGALVALRAQECARLKLEAEAYDPFERDPAVIQRRWKAIAAKEKEKDHIMSVFDEMDKPIECEWLSLWFIVLINKGLNSVNIIVSHFWTELPHL